MGFEQNVFANNKSEIILHDFNQMMLSRMPIVPDYLQIEQDLRKIHQDPKRLMGIHFLEGNRGAEYLSADFESPNGKSVSLLGINHISTKKFYEKINQKIDQYESKKYIIGYEGTGENDNPNSFSPEDEPYFDSFNRLGEAVQKFLHSSVGTEFQHNYIKPKKTWINTDVSMKELLEFTKANQLWLPTGEKTVQKEEEILIQCLFTNNGIREAKNASWPNFMDALLDFRNKHIVQEILRINKIDGKSIAMVWGAVHIPGVSELLKKHGYTEKQKYWIGE